MIVMDVQAPAEPAPVQRKMVSLFSGARRRWKYVLKVSGLIILFWIIQLAYQYATGTSAELSIVRGSAITGATLIGISLIIGPLARLYLKKNYVPHRRTIGVWGFTFILVHYFSVLGFVFGWNPAMLFWDQNPFVNRLLFGLLAFWLFIPLYVTSTDWAAQRLGFRKWKGIHRMVYVAYIFAVLHYAFINPAALLNPFGYLLIGVTIAALALQLAAFIKVTKLKLTKDTIIGVLIILLGVLLLGYSFFGRPG